MIGAKPLCSTTKMILARTQQGLEPILRVVERGSDRYCPCCESALRRFKPYGVVPRPNVMCEVCGSPERVPITAATTYEDPSVTDPKERERLFRPV
jgi:hypothetical protein